MRSPTLFLMVKTDLEKLSAYRSQIEQKILADTNSNSIGSIMTRYNYSTFNEIINSKSFDLNLEIDDDKLKDFQYRIDNYLNTYAPGEADLSLYIKCISTYLAFIVKKPLHPPGLEFSNSAKVFEKDGLFYCSGKRTFIKDDLSLCKYCICRPE